MSLSPCCQRSINTVPTRPETTISTMFMYPPRQRLDRLLPPSGDEHADQDGGGGNCDRHGQRLAHPADRQRPADGWLQVLPDPDTGNAAAPKRPIPSDIAHDP